MQKISRKIVSYILLYALIFSSFSTTLQVNAEFEWEEINQNIESYNHSSSHEDENSEHEEESSSHEDEDSEHEEESSSHEDEDSEHEEESSSHEDEDSYNENDCPSKEENPIIKPNLSIEKTKLEEFYIWSNYYVKYWITVRNDWENAYYDLNDKLDFTTWVTPYVKWLSHYEDDDTDTNPAVNDYFDAITDTKIIENELIEKWWVDKYFYKTAGNSP